MFYTDLPYRCLKRYGTGTGTGTGDHRTRNIHVRSAMYCQLKYVLVHFGKKLTGRYELDFLVLKVFKKIV